MEKWEGLKPKLIRAIPLSFSLNYELDDKEYKGIKCEELKEQVMSFIVQLPKKAKESKVPDTVRENNSMKKTRTVLITIHTIRYWD